MLKNRSMPECVVVPVLSYAEVPLAIEWLCQAFGFTPRLRMGDHRAQLNAGSGAVVLTARRTGEEGCRQEVMVRVENVDRHHERAVAAGARVLTAPTNYPYGERQYNVEDLAGHRWTFSESVADVDPRDWGGMPAD